MGDWSPDRSMEYNRRRSRSRTPEKGIQEVSVCVFSKTMNNLNSESKENKKRMDSDLLESLKKENSDLKGRLCESRSSRDAALKKNSLMQESHLSSLKQLQEVINKLESKNKILQKERDVDVYEQLKCREKQLEQIEKEQVDLKSKFDALTDEISEKDANILELKQRIAKLENFIRSLEAQKEDLVETAQEYIQKGNDYDKQRGAMEILQQQLDKAQSSWEQAKDELSDQKMRNRELERNLAMVEKELATFKVDVRLLTRQRKELEEKLQQEASASSSSRENIREILQDKMAGEKRIMQLENELDTLKRQTDTSKSALQDKEAVIKELKDSREKLEDNLRTARKELKETKDEFSDYDDAKRRLNNLTDSLKQKEAAIVEKDKAIEKLQQGSAKLKNACVMLESQLKEFEKLLGKQQQDLEDSHKAREESDKKAADVQEELRKTKIALNEATSLKLYTEKKLADLEQSIKMEEEDKVVEIQNLKTRIVDLKRSNDLLTEKMSDLLDRLDEFQTNNDGLEKQFESLQSENALLKEDGTRTITELMTIKESNSKLTAALEEAVSKCEHYKDRMESMSEDMALLEVGNAEKELRWQTVVNQQAKLIEHLTGPKEQLSAKKKRNFAGKLFAWDKEHKEVSTPISQLARPVPNSTPRRLIQEHKVVKNLEEEAANLKSQLARLQYQKEIPQEINLIDGADKESITSITSEDSVESLDRGVQRLCIFSEEGNERLEINHIQCITNSLFLIGCEQGLFSRRINDGKPQNYVVPIEGPGAIYQIEFLMSLNMAVFIEGKTRRIAYVHLSLLRACAEAAACAKPKVKLQYILDLKNCHNIHIQKTIEGGIYIVAASEKHLSILFWEKDAFVLRHSLKTPGTVTCVLPTPNSVIFGCDKIFELDVKNFAMEEFMDESDESMMYAMLACRESVNFPVAILDVSRSTATAGSPMITEYLLCCSDLAIFVDAYGRRSRSEDIMWSKIPLGVFYRHPNLFVVHFNSVEVIPLSPKSFTKARVIKSVDSIGKDVINIPESRYITLPNARYLGNGTNGTSLLVGTLNKSNFEIFEVEAAPGE